MDPSEYLSPSPITSAASLPTVAGVAEARTLTQNLLVHAYWLGAYGVTEQRPEERQLRTVAALLDRAGSPLETPRSPAQKVQVTCRDFTVLYVALLRAAGIPARARAGFASYFRPGAWEDHWVAERWTGDRWARDDAQIDDVQRSMLKLDFETTRRRRRALPGGVAATPAHRRPHEPPLDRPRRTVPPTQARRYHRVDIREGSR